MSHKEFFKKASKKDALQETDSEPVVNRFSDTREIDKRRHDVLDYMIIGYEPEEIAEFMDEDVHTILNDVKAIVKIGYEAREDDVTEVRDEIMRIYRLSIKESFSAFKMSQGEVETRTVKYGEGGDVTGNGEPGNIEEEKVKTEKQSGDAKHMRNVIDAAEKMGKVSGAQKHKEVEIQQNVQNNNVKILSPNKTEMPSDFDRWTKKPDGEEIPDGKNVDMEDL